MSGNLSEHLEVRKSDHVFLEAEEMNTKGDINYHHHWTEVVIAMMVFSMILSMVLSVVLSILLMVAILLRSLILGLIPNFISKHSVSLSSTVPLWYLWLFILSPKWDWWSHFWSFIHNLIHETINFPEIWIIKIKMEFLTIDVGIKNEI